MGWFNIYKFRQLETNLPNHLNIKMRQCRLQSYSL